MTDLKSSSQTPPLQPEVPVAAPWSFTSISQAIVQFAELLLLSKAAPEEQVAPEVLRAMQRLVTMIEQLRSPENGWPADLEPTPANLAQYVTEEAYEVLQTIQDFPPVPATAVLDHPLPSLVLMETLIPELLWWLASHSPEIMRLLEGLPARIKLPEQPEQFGILRLSVLLNLETETQKGRFDLAMQESAHLAGLAPDTIICLQSPLFSEPLQQALTLAQLLQLLQQMMPGFARLQQRQAIELFQPGSSWQPGFFSLELDLAFTAMPAIPVDDLAPTTFRLPTAFLRTAQIEQTLQQLSLAPISDFETQQEEADFLVLELVEAACHLLPDTSSSCVSQQTLQPKVSLEEWIGELQEPLCSGASGANLSLEAWMSQIFWQMTRHSYRLMQLCGGVRSRVLQPGENWLMGDLRLRAILKIELFDCAFDLLTAQPLFESAGLEPGSVFQPLQVGSQAPLVPIANLLTELQAQLLTDSVLQQLLSGITVEASSADQAPQSTAVQLKVDFEFVPVV